MTLSMPKWVKPDLSSDEGMTLVEAMVAIAIFSLIMVLMSSILIFSMGDLGVVTQKLNAGGSQQNAIEWSSRELRYIAPPSAGLTAIETAKPNDFTFYTYSGTTSGNADVPVKVRLYVDPKKGFMTSVKEPVMNGAVPTYPNPAIVRMLIPVDEVVANGIVFTYYDANDAIQIMDNTGKLSDANKVLTRSVRIRFVDPETGQQVEQVVRLVNLST